MHNLRYTIPISLAVVASNALGALRDVHLQIPPQDTDPLSLETEQLIDNLLAKRQVKETIAHSFDSMTSILLDEEGDDIRAKYLPPGLDKMVWGYGEQDSTDITPGAGACYTNCYSNCYSNCHGACHGSRGWR